MHAATRKESFGTDQEVSAPRRLAANGLSVQVSEGAIRNVSWHGVEVLRAITYPVRNLDWGTYPTITLDEAFDETPDSFAYRRVFSVADRLFDGEFTCSGAAGGKLRVALRLVANRAMEANRIGLVVLHPIAGVAGSPLRVTHGDGSVEDTWFPQVISPHQPVFDIVSLRQQASGVVAEITFVGETFEMEDQRNWSDASYKTYCRPLSRPYPFPVAAEDVIEQSLYVAMAGGGGDAVDGTTPNRLTFGAPTGRRLPEPALALEMGWGTTNPAVARLGVPATVLRVDLTKSNWDHDLPELLALTSGALDLEAIVADDVAAIDGALAQLAAGSASAPRSITALPAAYLKSYQPDAIWPSGATPEQAADAARKHFPYAEIGGGMLTNFTELNRYRSAARAGDFVTYGTTAIVHEADDQPVLQTLETLPQIFASAEALAPDRAYRLGLVSIGMRSNPYGADVADNPDNIRQPMARLDPRQNGLFAAAFMVGAMAATEASALERIALAAPAGPFGLVDDTSVRPVFHVQLGFIRMSHRPRLATKAPKGTLAVAVEGAAILANVSTDPQAIVLPAPARVALLDRLQPDPDWLTTSERQERGVVELAPFSVAFLSWGTDDLFGVQA